MQLDFHYYATYCAAILAGYSHEDSLSAAWSAQFVDCCSETVLKHIGGPVSAATTQLQLELMDSDTDILGLQKITRIWSSFHFLPGDLYAERKKCSKRFLRKYRLICNPNGKLLVDTVELARGQGIQAAGVAMHILADTWAHRYFAGTPSLVINSTNYYFYELIPVGDHFFERPVRFNHNPASADDPETGLYTGTIQQGGENSIMNLGHGRAGHLPDYSYARYRYLPSWGDYQEVIKDNPSDYEHAFRQMVYALKSLRTPGDRFETGHYDEEAVLPWLEQIREIINRRQTDASADWKALAEKISGHEVEDFDAEKYHREYIDTDKEHRDDTYLGRFIIAALSQKSMVTNRIFSSGNMLAGFSVDFQEKGFRGIRDYRRLLKKLQQEDSAGSEKEETK
ncbi:MAG: hypothetical protein IJJ25_03350 [Lachnospiraceae bacterium]|nr:hypothetical protein [Lachnospiraceae bacterium]